MIQFYKLREIFPVIKNFCFFVVVVVVVVVFYPRWIIKMVPNLWSGPHLRVRQVYSTQVNKTVITYNRDNKLFISDPECKIHL